MNWKKALTSVVTKHLSEESIGNILQAIQSSSHNEGRIPTSKIRGYMMPVGMSAYITSFLFLDEKRKILYYYSFDEKGGITPNVSEYQLTEEDLATLNSGENWPKFNINDLHRIYEAPFSKEIFGTTISKMLD